VIRLRIHSGPFAGREIVTAASLIRIGRDPAKNDLVIAGDEQVSGRHCQLQRSPRGTYVLEDVGSSNGTRVNGRRIANVGTQTAVYLAAGDRFELGTTTIEIRDGKARLTVVEGPKRGRDLALDERLLSIGRASDNLLDLDDAEVSAYHAVIRCTPLGFVLEDLGSTNGCLVNGTKTKHHALSDGDELAIGRSRLRFMIDELEEVSRFGESPKGAEAFGRLVVVGGPAAGRSLPLGAGQVVLGRRDDATLQISDEQVSSIHCAVTRVDDGFVLTDLKSSNGTFLNGTRLATGTVLKPGDLIAIGTTVVEFKLVGGAPSLPPTLAPQPAPSKVVAEGAYEVAPQHKFVIGGHVVAGVAQVTIGRAPSCDLRLDGVGVSKEHCKIVWRDGFVLEDGSTHGTYVNDRRIVREKLAGEQVVRVGLHLINLSIRGDRCSIEPIDAARAMAAIEVAREGAEVLARASLAPAEAAAGQYGGLGAGYRTVFQLPGVADTDALIREREQKFKKGAPAWRPSSDIARDRFGKIAVSSAVLAAIGVAALLVFTSDAGALSGALLNHPLGEAHASRAFADQAAELGLGTSCTACHTVGDGVDQRKCVACHPGFGDHQRPGHVATGAAAKGGVRPGRDCTGCHAEHRGTPRFVAEDVPSHLGATSSCTDAACHEDPHSADFLQKGPPPPQVLEAGPVPDFRMPQRDFHAAHAVVEPNSGVGPTAVGCTACHATAGKDGALVEAVAGRSCFRCHAGGEEHVAAQCGACHDDEHRGAAALVRLPPRDPKLAPATPPPRAMTSLAWGGALGAVAFVPLVLVAGFRRSRRRQRSVQAVEELRSHPVEMVKRLIHSINMDKCVGCAMCVQACPASVLELVNHKSVVVNFDACIQCKKCEIACAFDALRMHDADKPPPTVSMPEVDANYETAVPGLYLIGQASGTPQIKNASNLGRAVVQHAVAAGLKPGGGRAVGADVDVIVAGAGPAGMSAGFACQALGLSYVVFEKERETSWTVRNYYHKGKPVMAEPNDVELVGHLPHWDTTREELLGKWDAMVRDQKLDVRVNQQVASIKKDGEKFVVELTDRDGKPLGAATAARVVISIGTMGNPRKLGCPGENLEKVKNSLVDPDEWRGKNVMVVGGTDSAIEVILALMEHNKVYLSSRGAKFDRVKPKNLQLIEAAFAAGKCTPMWATAVAEVTADTIVLEHKADGRKEAVPCDVVFAMIGGNPPIKWLQSVGIGYVDKPHSWSPPRTDELAKKSAAG
jgi:pSer/pThr/pTyr-binding forkhead associated (FHA) protein/thioredoxin reductase/NAD-dependent dihydropyrimidine dehydrogenase PreA subunit